MLDSLVIMAEDIIMGNTTSIIVAILPATVTPMNLETSQEVIMLLQNSVTLVLDVMVIGVLFMKLTPRRLAMIIKNVAVSAEVSFGHQLVTLILLAHNAMVKVISDISSDIGIEISILIINMRKIKNYIHIMSATSIKKLFVLLFVILTCLSGKAAPKAKFGYILFEPEANCDWVVEDSLVRIGANIGEGGGWQEFNPIGVVCIYNKTNDVIYIDLAQCFISRNGRSQALWDNTQVIHTSGKNSGVSMNLGSIANALGVGGSVGTLASGINVGGGTNSSTATISQAERIIAVAPLSQYTITESLVNADFALPNFKIRKTTGWNKNRIDGATLVLTDLYAGQIVSYTKETTPINISFFVKYSSDSDLKNAHKQRMSFWAKELIGTKKAWWNDKKARDELTKYGRGDINQFIHCMHFYVDKNW